MMLFRRIRVGIYSILTLFAFETMAQAGMPSPYLVITELGRRRFEELSFFFLGFLLMSAICRWLWNGLAKDFPGLPRLSYRGSIGMMILWGLALTVVLSLVSGARELMTPAAWEPNGITHRLVGATPDSSVDKITERWRRMESLKKSLWEYAASHDSVFPNDIELLPSDVVVADQVTGIHYFLTPELSISSAKSILASEPDIYSKRLQLLTDGEIIIVDRQSERMP